ncbi:Ribokinase-like protein [Glomus cerebriforme]|uniref:Adenosine kinase n=1 Tax=Glomus cerebriforme TaxID=658196 RepID=A0A397SF86_9GLOM|nr:Ribokinase-like protein [Glomus cerebriforme]
MSTETSKEYILLGISNAILDLFVYNSEKVEKLIEKYGFLPKPTNKDLNKVNEFLNEVSKYPDTLKVSGGTAQNSLRGAQRLLPPNSTIFIGCIGKDEHGKILKEALNNDGVRTEYMEIDDYPTGISSFSKLSNNKYFVKNNKGASTQSKLTDLKSPSKWKFIENAKYFYVCGYILKANFDIVQEISKHALENKKIYATNLSSVNLVTRFKHRIDEISPYWDLIFGNESEALAFAKMSNWDTEDIFEVVKKIAQLPKYSTNFIRMAVITRDEKSTIYANQNGVVKEYPIIPVKKNDLVDVTGAGDSFVGGFLSQFIQGKNIDECIMAGHRLANYIVRQVGTRYDSFK